MGTNYGFGGLLVGSRGKPEPMRYSKRVDTYVNARVPGRNGSCGAFGVAASRSGEEHGVPLRCPFRGPVELGCRRCFDLGGVLDDR